MGSGYLKGGYFQSIKKENLDEELDAGIKLLILIMLTFLLFYCHKNMSLYAVFSYTLVITFFMGMKFHYFIKNVISFAIIFILPYTFSLIFSFILAFYFQDFYYYINFKEIFMKFLKIFFVWYIGNVYFYTTNYVSIFAMINKIVPYRMGITSLLNKILCIIIQITKTLNEFRNYILNPALLTFKNKNLSLKNKIKEIANILVSYIVNSLEQVEDIERLIAQTDINKYTYKIKLTQKETILLISFIVFIIFYIFLETNFITF